MTARPYRQPPTITIDPQPVLRIVAAVVAVAVVLLFISTGSFVIPPGHRGVQLTLGRVSPEFKPEGLGFKLPFISTIHRVSIRQQTRSLPAECYTSELQPLSAQVEVLYRIPEDAVVKIFREYQGEPFDTLIAPRVQEALKEVAAARTGEMIVKERREVKLRALELARAKVDTNLLEIVDLVLFDIRLSATIESAIEEKMIEEQKAERAKFTQLKTQIEADTKVIRARGEAESIATRGQALRANPGFIKLQVIETWNGRSPLVVGSSGGAGLLLEPDPTRTTGPAPNRRVIESEPVRARRP